MKRVSETRQGLFSADMATRFRTYTKVYPAKIAVVKGDTLEIPASDIPRDANAVEIKPKGKEGEYAVQFYHLGRVSRLVRVQYGSMEWAMTELSAQLS
jgi:hypothetical protein